MRATFAMEIPCLVIYCFQSPTVYRSASFKLQKTWDYFNTGN